MRDPRLLPGATNPTDVALVADGTEVQDVYLGPSADTSSVALDSQRPNRVDAPTGAPALSGTVTGASTSSGTVTGTAGRSGTVTGASTSSGTATGTPGGDPPPEPPAQQTGGGKFGFYDKPLPPHLLKPLVPVALSGQVIGVSGGVGLVRSGTAGRSGVTTGASTSRAYVSGHAARSGRVRAHTSTVSHEVRGQFFPFSPLVRCLRDDEDLLTLI